MLLTVLAPDAEQVASAPPSPHRAAPSQPHTPRGYLEAYSCHLWPESAKLSFTRPPRRSFSWPPRRDRVRRPSVASLCASVVTVAGTQGESPPGSPKHCESLQHRRVKAQSCAPLLEECMKTAAKISSPEELSVSPLQGAAVNLCRDASPAPAVDTQQGADVDGQSRRSRRRKRAGVGTAFTPQTPGCGSVSTGSGAGASTAGTGSREGAAERPCSHNTWDYLRYRKDSAMLRCRACQQQWKAGTTQQLRRVSCSAFTSAGGCALGTNCHLMHVYRSKKEKAAAVGVPVPLRQQPLQPLQPVVPLSPPSPPHSSPPCDGFSDGRGSPSDVEVCCYIAPPDAPQPDPPTPPHVGLPPSPPLGVVQSAPGSPAPFTLPCGAPGGWPLVSPIAEPAPPPHRVSPAPSVGSTPPPPLSHGSSPPVTPCHSAPPLLSPVTASDRSPAALPSLRPRAVAYQTYDLPCSAPEQAPQSVVSPDTGASPPTTRSGDSCMNSSMGVSPAYTQSDVLTAAAAAAAEYQRAVSNPAPFPPPPRSGSPAPTPMDYGHHHVQHHHHLQHHHHHHHHHHHPHYPQPQQQPQQQQMQHLVLVHNPNQHVQRRVVIVRKQAGWAQP
eukprot:TRINITY_DN8912_c0_g1_i1.p1 TRINITY_DN8912_c0_g1~~TRINITY_DN8912_c0_g1_i1.p1  ORF type:complete len:609 (+),score=186.04 TRINITY_DN8912_c0_g1_i1:224-2050(+)